MLLLRRILPPLTIPHEIIRRASETIAARVRTVGETAAIAAVIVGVGEEVAGDAGLAEEVIAEEVIAEDVTTARAGAICLLRNTHRRRANVIRAALTIAALPVIAPQARQSNGGMTTSSFRANRSPSIVDVRRHRRSSPWEITSPRSVSLILRKNPRARQSACSRILACQGVSLEACRIGF